MFDWNLPPAGGRQHMTRRDHYLRDTRYLRRQPFGRGVSPRRTVLLVPELRKRRHERDPAELARQMDAAAGMRRRKRG